MAYSPSPQTVVAGSSTQLNRISASPTTQFPLSKRDKKRLNMADRLTEISNNFTANRDTFYRQQLQAYQADINYIQQANPYSNKALEYPTDDPSEEAAGSAAASTQGSLRTTQQTHQNSIGRTELPFKTGRHTAQFVQNINDAMEKRDVDLTTLVYRHNFRIDELQKDNEYQVAVAHEEHQRLLEVVRQRLIQGVNQKKAFLLKEKEKLDTADSNTLLFRPDQFTINNTASPGGPQSNRKTRHTRHRLDAEDMDTTTGNKRKRKGPADGENGSPTPAGRDVEAINVLKEANVKLEAHRHHAPLYSIDRLFSEKELNGNLQQASYYVIENMKRRKLNADAQNNLLSLVPTNADGTDNEDEGGAEANFGNDVAMDDALLTAPEMGRSITNTSYHATRSTRVQNLSNGISAGDSLGELAGRHSGVALIGVYQKEKKREDEYNRAPGLSDQEAETELALMKALMAEEDEGKTVNTKLLDDVVEYVADYVGPGGTQSSHPNGYAVEVGGL
ncbi:hypothetical protein JMJ35_002882 [Cladonia borealis]|uniref:Uncharacterized protein n=1 Tax=Cladonia borealis TaxID=184061 RepID=A0AA39R5N5_9LECA|nr:hypothetical protein JMJ35_002882 [Cladonia borealis]